MSIATKSELDGRVCDKTRVVGCLGIKQKSSRKNNVYFGCDRRRRGR